MQDYEESVLFLGSWGPFQRRIFFVLCLTCVPCGYNILSVIFLLASPPHHCDIPAHSNLSQEPEVLLSSLKREGCRDGWTYSTQYFQSTVVTEFDLVCSEQWKQPLTSLVYFLGGLSGCFISGLISDRFGRKPVLFGSIAVLSIFSSAVAFAPSWPVFTVLFFMLGLGQIACYIVVFVLGSEILVGSSRILFSSLGQPFVYAFSMMLLPGTAYLVRSWRHLSLIMAVPGLACIPLWWLVPESPRWLLSRGRLQEAELLLRSAALVNRVEAPPVIFLPPKAEKAAESVSFLDLLKTAKIRHITLKLWLIWFSMSASYFGLSFSMSTLYGNLFLNYFLLTVVELPAYFASWLAARSFPRRLSFIGFSLLGALALLFIQVATKCYPTLTMSLVLLGKFGVLAGNGVVYTYTGELSPTVIRNTAMSSCAMFSRVGSSVSPYLLEMGETFKCLQILLPWITLGVLSLLGVLLCIFLPETFRQPLPDTIEQMPNTTEKSYDGFLT
uniref:Major facilitator superfamily (MFS) profile domain-containing protein n=1 Tax=Xiphophorus couchianus TaxID=32473 RepID=A0A3B5MM26_9TELE